MRSYLLLPYLIISTISYAQKKTIGIKLYQNSDFFNVKQSASSSSPEETKSFSSFTRFSVAVHFSDTEKKISHEIELFVPQLQGSFGVFQLPTTYETFLEVNDPALRSSTFAARYEIIRTVSESAPVNFSIGGAINPYYTYLNRPDEGNRFQVMNKYLGASVNVVPRLSFKFSKRLSADLNVPFKIYDFQFIRTHVNNPGLAPRQQVRDETKNIFFQNAYTIRLGIIYNIERKVEESSDNAKKRTGYNDPLKKRRKRR